MYPVQRSVRNLTGTAALLEDEAAHKLLSVDAHTPHRMRRATRVRINRHKLCCAEASSAGPAAAPVRLHYIAKVKVL